MAAVLHQPIAAERAAPMLAPLGYHMNRLCDDVLKRWREFEREMNRSDEDGGDAVMRSSWVNRSAEIKRDNRKKKFEIYDIRRPSHSAESLSHAATPCERRNEDS